MKRRPTPSSGSIEIIGQTPFTNLAEAWVKELVQDMPVRTGRPHPQAKTFEELSMMTGSSDAAIRYFVKRHPEKYRMILGSIDRGNGRSYPATFVLEKRFWEDFDAKNGNQREPKLAID